MEKEIAQETASSPHERVSDIRNQIINDFRREMESKWTNPESRYQVPSYGIDFLNMALNLCVNIMDSLIAKFGDSSIKAIEETCEFLNLLQDIDPSYLENSTEQPNKCCEYLLNFCFNIQEKMSLNSNWEPLSYLCKEMIDFLLGYVDNNITEYQIPKDAGGVLLPSNTTI